MVFNVELYVALVEILSSLRNLPFLFYFIKIKTPDFKHHSEKASLRFFNQSFFIYFLNIAQVRFIVPNSESFVFHPWTVSNIFFVSFKGCLNDFVPCHPSPVP